MNNPPAGVDRAAPVVARHELSIKAPAAVVWELLTDVSSWPSWQPDIVSAHAPHPLTPGATFHWRTAGLDIASTVYAVEAPRRILWGGPAQGITAVHQWTLTSSGSAATLVATEESWDGAPVRADAANIRQALDESLVQWLGHLKSAAETPR
ncbi:SRPBCC family protein [Streptomyces sp. NPDC007851]|uniref:SRPBCC family protein n=1 Tax=Streptomyces sp. NPDC007851 TaxID=3155008 RepID=UPI0033F3FD74